VAPSFLVLDRALVLPPPPVEPDLTCGDITVEFLESCPQQFFPAFSNYERKQFDSGGDLVSHNIYIWSFTVPWVLFINAPFPGNSVWVPDAVAGDNIGTFHTELIFPNPGMSDTCISFQFPIGCGRTALTPQIGCGPQPDDPKQSAWFCEVELAAGGGFGPFFRFWQPLNGCPTGGGWTFIPPSLGFCPLPPGTGGTCYIDGSFSI